MVGESLLHQPSQVQMLEFRMCIITIPGLNLFFFLNRTPGTIECKWGSKLFSRESCTNLSVFLLGRTWVVFNSAHLFHGRKISPVPYRGGSSRTEYTQTSPSDAGQQLCTAGQGCALQVSVSHELHLLEKWRLQWTSS